MPVLQLGVDSFAWPALAGVRGVDGLLVARQAPVAAGVRVEATSTLRSPDDRSAALLSGIGNRVDARGVEGVDDAVLAGGAHVVACAGQHR